MQSRPGLKLVAAALVCIPLLSSCGFDKATDRIYTQADGINYRHGTVYVLNGVIASAQSGSGTLIASLSNQSDTSTETLDSVAGSGGNTVTVADFAPIAIAPMGFVNLADSSTSINISGDFAAGDIIPLSLTLKNGTVIDTDVPVVYACQEYAGLDKSQAAASSSAGAVTLPSSAPTAITPVTPTDASTASTAPTAAPSQTTEPSPSGSPSVYTCDTSGGTGARN